MRVAVVTGSRADRGPLGPVQRATNGIWVPVRPPKPASARATVTSCATALATICEQLSCTDPDLVVLLGDRHEILASAMASYLLNIPVAHLSGGDITEGSQDESMRHAITKLSHLHFPTNALSATRIMQMGEEAWRVHVTGCPGIDSIFETPLLTRTQTMHRLGAAYDYILVAYQPATLDEDPVGNAEKLSAALAQLELPCIFTTLNADTHGLQIERKFANHCRTFGGTMLDMDHQLFLSAMKHCTVMVGNSSSGLYEAPTLKKPFVNIGRRQLGRLQANSVIACSDEPEDILRAIRVAMGLDCSETINPYGDGKAAVRIAKLIGEFGQDKQKLLNKKWATGWPNPEGIVSVLADSALLNEFNDTPVRRSIN